MILLIIFYLFIFLFFICNLIYLSILIRKNIKNKKTIEQAKIRLAEIEKARKQIEEQEKERVLFYTSLIHEMKIPLSIIQNTIDSYCESQKTNGNGNLKTVKNTIAILNRDISNILDTEKVNHSQLLYNHITVFNISKAIKKEIEIFKVNTNNKHIALTLVSEGALFIKIDPAAFDRIVNNLLDNAIKYTPIGGKINIAVFSDTSTIRLAIKDNGVGIPANELQKIFKPYYRIKRGELSEQGLGIGLFLVKTIVESAGGNIEIASELHKGTTFSVIFPKYNPTEKDRFIDFTPKEAIEHENITFSTETYDVNKYTILIVEDNIKLLIFLQQNLLKIYNVYHATDGKKALDRLFHIPKPDIIISDIMMGTMDGHEFFNKLCNKKGYENIPFVFLTSKTDQTEKIRSLKQGAIDYICKPFNIEEVKAKIETILKQRDKTKEKEIKKIEEQIYSVIGKKGDKRFFDFEMKCKECKLTPREKEIVRYLTKGLEIKEIGGKLFLSAHTIRNHVRHIYEKCNVQNRVELLNLFKK